MGNKSQCWYEGREHANVGGSLSDNPYAERASELRKMGQCNIAMEVWAKNWAEGFRTMYLENVGENTRYEIIQAIKRVEDWDDLSDEYRAKYEQHIEAIVRLAMGSNIAKPAE